MIRWNGWLACVRARSRHAAIILALCLLGYVGPVKAAAPDRDLSLVLLIGQSNMAGQGKIEAQDKVPIRGVLKLSSKYQWQPAVEPLTGEKSRPFGVGPGRSFAQALLDARPDARIGLIPAAIGGSSLNQWSPGGPLYNRALRLLRVAQRSGKLVAILWHQGETDANSSAERSASYGDRWLLMMNQLRADIGMPDVPIIVGTLGPFLERPYARSINEQLEKLPEQMSRVAVVSSRGLRDRGDRLHFDTESQRILGRRYAKAFLNMVPEWRTAPSMGNGTPSRDSVSDYRSDNAHRGRPMPAFPNALPSNGIAHGNR